MIDLDINEENALWDYNHRDDEPEEGEENE